MRGARAISSAKRVRALERRNDSLAPRQRAHRVERGLIAHRRVFGAVLIREPGMLGPNRR